MIYSLASGIRVLPDGTQVRSVLKTTGQPFSGWGLDLERDTLVQQSLAPATPEEIREVIIQMCGYAGFPATLNAMKTLVEVLQETGQALPTDSLHAGSEGRYERGKNLLAMIAPEQERILKETYDPINPDIAKYVIAFGYGDIYARGLLSLRDRQVATIAALAAKGTAPSQLRFHIGGGFRAGLSEAEIVEIMLLISIYAGFPAALNGILATHEVAASMKENE